MDISLMDKVLEHPLIQTPLQAGRDWYASLNLTSMDLALIGSLLVSWAALVLILSAMKRVKKQSSTTYKLCEKLVHDLHIASSGAIGMGQRIIAMERKIANQPEVATAKPVLRAVPKQAEPAPLPNFANLINSSISETPVQTPVSKTESPKAEENPFDTAKALLRRGVAQKEVARRCGLSLSETALMAMVLNNREGRASRLAS